MTKTRQRVDIFGAPSGLQRDFFETTTGLVRAQADQGSSLARYPSGLYPKPSPIHPQPWRG
ncbi:hypothetical protein [Parapedobacter tibetensis]|uniref:hypothetical protein n=1 Tax=Parapedobacter tibetensis TaxID=2972951 RepID=UPI00214DE974|nr:hypothetical protein [Parapedobacter tibetensis]